MPGHDMDQLRLKRMRLEQLRASWRKRQEAADMLKNQIILLEAEISRLSRRTGSGSAVSSELRYGSVKSQIIAILSSHPSGLDSVSIGHSLKKLYGSAISPRSHLTTLNRLREAGQAVKDNGRWKLTSGSVDSREKIDTTV